MFRRKTLFYLIVLITLILLSVLVVSLFVGSVLSAAQLKKIGPPPADLVVETHFITSASGSLLPAWLLPGRINRSGILLMHGVRSNRLQMLDRARFLNRAGYTVLLFDFQAHGESRGQRITFGYQESRDAQAAFAYLRQQIPKQPIGVIGVSLGGAAALLGSLAQRADALVLEAVYPSFEQAVANRLVIRLGPLGAYLSPLLTWQSKFRLGVDAQWLTPIKYIASSKAALLIIAGTEDQHTTLAESQYLFQQAPQPKIFWPLSGAAHVDFHDYAPAEYEQKILQFFSQYLTAAD